MPGSNTCAVCACLNDANCADTCIYSPYFPPQAIEKFKLLLGVYPLDEISKIIKIPSVTEDTKRQALDMLYSEAEIHLRIQDTMRRQRETAEQISQLLGRRDIAISPDFYSFYMNWILDLPYNYNSDKDVFGSNSSSVSVGSESSSAQPYLGHLNIAISPDLHIYYIKWILNLPYNDDNDRDVFGSNSSSVSLGCGSSSAAEPQTSQGSSSAEQKSSEDVARQQRTLLRKRLEVLSKSSAVRESASSRQEEKGVVNVGDVNKKRAVKTEDGDDVPGHLHGKKRKA